MGKKRMRTEQIISKMRAVEVLTSQGRSICESCRQESISEQTYYRWRKEYGGLQLDQAKRFKVLEKENLRLKRLVADLSLDNAILREAASGNC